MPEFPLVLVHWVDAVSGDEWRPISALKSLKPDSVITVGFVIKETNKRLVIAASISGEMAGEYIVIPKSWIKRVIRAQ